MCAISFRELTDIYDDGVVEKQVSQGAETGATAPGAGCRGREI